MAHNRKLVLGAVALTQAKLPARQTALAMGNVRDELEQEMIRSRYLDGAPFRWIGLVIRQGLIDEVLPHYQKIDQKDGELPLAIEVDSNRLVGAPLDRASDIYRKAALLALADAADKFGLNADRIRLLLDGMATR